MVDDLIELYNQNDKIVISKSRWIKFVGLLIFISFILFEIATKVLGVYLFMLLLPILSN